MGDSEADARRYGPTDADIEKAARKIKWKHGQGCGGRRTYQAVHEDRVFAVISIDAATWFVWLPAERRYLGSWSRLSDAKTAVAEWLAGGRR